MHIYGIFGVNYIMICLLWVTQNNRNKMRERDEVAAITLRAMSFQAPVSTRRPSHVQWERLPLPALRAADVFQP